MDHERMHLYPRMAVKKDKGFLPGRGRTHFRESVPEIATVSGSVDPLSLALSLQDEADERVQNVLDELREKFPR